MATSEYRDGVLHISAYSRIETDQGSVLQVEGLDAHALPDIMAGEAFTAWFPGENDGQHELYVGRNILKAVKVELDEKPGSGKIWFDYDYGRLPKIEYRIHPHPKETVHGRAHTIRRRR